MSANREEPVTPVPLSRAAVLTIIEAAFSDGWYKGAHYGGTVTPDFDADYWAGLVDAAEVKV